MIKSIFIGGAYTNANPTMLKCSNDLTNCIKEKYPNIKIVSLKEVDMFREDYVKNHPNAEIEEIDKAMAKFDLEFVKNCDLFIANVTERSTGLGLELGSILNSNKKILLVAESGAIVSNMIIGAFVDNEIHYYKDFEELKNIVLNYLSKC